MARIGTHNILQAIEEGTFFIEKETPVGSVNGSNKVFTLAHNPNPDSSLEVKINGQIQTLTTDYSLSGDTITLVLAWPTGTTIRVNYRVTPQ